MLIDAIARQTIENSAGFKEFMDGANEEISKLTNPENVPVLADISGNLTSILSAYYKDSEIVATWSPVTQITPSFPSAFIEIKNNDYVTGLEGVGHGLQRAVILTVLRFMADHQAAQEASGKEFSEAESDLIVAIEEPEIYQHPTKQRLFGRVLPKLSVGFNKKTGIRVQTIFVTHSPLLVSIDHCEGIRLVRRVSEEGKKNVAVKGMSLDQCSRRSAEISGQRPQDAWSGTQFGAKLHTFGSEIAEGFFARCVFLVEGIGDKAVIEAWYAINERDPHAEGIVIAEVSGKSNLIKPAIIFEALGIPCYLLFDNDKSGDKQWPSGRFARFTSWDNKLEKYIEDKVGKVNFQNACAEFSAEWDIDPDMCLKFPASAIGMLKKFCETGQKFSELDEILKCVDELLKK